MMSGAMDGIAQALNSSLHFRNGCRWRAPGTTTGTPPSGTRRPSSRS